MKPSAITIRLKGKAHRYFDSIPPILNKRRLFIVKYPVSSGREIVDNRKTLKEGYTMTTIQVITTSTINLSILVAHALGDIEKLYPNTTRIIDIDYSKDKN